MSVRIFCECGKDITDRIPVFDKKTRTIDWMDRNPPVCDVCADADIKPELVNTPAHQLPLRHRHAGSG